MYFSHSSSCKNNASSASPKSSSKMLDSRSLISGYTTWIKLFFTMLTIGFALVAPMQRANAEAEQLVFEVFVDQPIGHRDLVGQAELEAKRLISQRFHEDSGISSLQVSILLNRNGEVIPMFVTTVSRQQWNHSPQVSPWTKYHNSYALLKRHDIGAGQPTVIATTPRISPNSIAAAPRAYESAFDRGGLSSKIIQDSLDHWD